MSGLIVVPAVPSQVPCLLATVRPEDRDEWVASSGAPVGLSLLGLTSEGGLYGARTAFSTDGKTLAMWGVTQGEEAGTGYVWLIATTAAYEWVLSLHKILHRELDALHSRSPTLVAIADCRNDLHHRWLDWLGFHHERTIPYGPWSLPFKLYVRTKCVDQ